MTSPAHSNDGTTPAPRRSSALVWIGLAAVIMGLVGAVILFVLGQQRATDAVERLARAPVGCDTTLEFSGTGSFVVYVETRGRVDQLDGGCEAPTTYDRRTATTPDATIELTGPDGDQVAIDSSEAAGYDTDQFTGEPVGEVRIETSGRHLVRVTSDDDDFVVAIGRDPTSADTPFTVAAALVGLAGLISAATMLAIARARRRIEPSDEPPVDGAPGFTPDAAPPTVVPLAPPPPGSVVAPPPTPPWGPPTGPPQA